MNACMQVPVRAWQGRRRRLDYGLDESVAGVNERFDALGGEGGGGKDGVAGLVEDDAVVERKIG